MASYLRDPVDDLPFGTEAKARRYATERYAGAVGRNWYTSRSVAAVRAPPAPRRRRAGVGRPAPRAARRADGRSDRRAGRGDRPQPAAAREVRPVGPRRQRGRDAGDVRGVAPRPDRAQLRLAGVPRGGAAGRCRPGAAVGGVGVPARPGRDRHDVRTRHGRRHGRAAGRRVRARRHQATRARAVRRRRVRRRGGADADRAHRRVRPRRAGDDGDARRRCVAPHRVQVVRLQRQRLGVRRARQAASARRTASAASPRSSCSASAATAAATGSASAG